jgi:hypothetical protein
MTDNTNHSDKDNKDKMNPTDAAEKQAKVYADKLAADKAKESHNDGQK